MIFLNNALFLGFGFEPSKVKNWYFQIWSADIFVDDGAYLQE